MICFSFAFFPIFLSPFVKLHHTGLTQKTVSRDEFRNCSLRCLVTIYKSSIPACLCNLCCSGTGRYLRYWAGFLTREKHCELQKKKKKAQVRRAFFGLENSASCARKWCISSYVSSYYRKSCVIKSGISPCFNKFLFTWWFSKMLPDVNLEMLAVQ